ncbi:hypothetical protein WN51_05817 [Melipona quadrifasciata]|uniref:Uncharacterized protein n=1 Tax=Melipona quadrifasciata TaxID=166423 RepID=A0A0M9A5Z7_9HYME|nr:hypothetical protein WN51_05817 [Melipona quadrifasciata]
MIMTFDVVLHIFVMEKSYELSKDDYKFGEFIAVGDYLHRWNQRKTEQSVMPFNLQIDSTLTFHSFEILEIVRLKLLSITGSNSGFQPMTDSTRYVAVSSRTSQHGRYCPSFLEQKQKSPSSLLLVIKDLRAEDSLTSNQLRSSLLSSTELRTKQLGSQWDHISTTAPKDASRLFHLEAFKGPIAGRESHENQRVHRCIATQRKLTFRPLSVGAVKFSGEKAQAVFLSDNLSICTYTTKRKETSPIDFFYDLRFVFTIVAPRSLRRDVKQFSSFRDLNEFSKEPNLLRKQSNSTDQEKSLTAQRILCECTNFEQQRRLHYRPDFPSSSEENTPNSQWTQICTTKYRQAKEEVCFNMVKPWSRPLYPVVNDTPILATRSRISSKGESLPKACPDDPDTWCCPMVAFSWCARRKRAHASPLDAQEQASGDTAVSVCVPGLSAMPVLPFKRQKKRDFHSKVETFWKLVGYCPKANYPVAGLHDYKIFTGIEKRNWSWDGTFVNDFSAFWGDAFIISVTTLNRLLARDLNGLSLRVFYGPSSVRHWGKSGDCAKKKKKKEKKVLNPKNSCPSNDKRPQPDKTEKVCPAQAAVFAIFAGKIIAEFHRANQHVTKNYLPCTYLQQTKRLERSLNRFRKRHRLAEVPEKSKIAKIISALFRDSELKFSRSGFERNGIKILLRLHYNGTTKIYYRLAIKEIKNIYDNIPSGTKWEVVLT